MARRLKTLWPQGGLWRHSDFLKLWSGQTISQVGSQVTALALPLAAVLVLDASAFEVALLGTVEFLPFLLFALPAGVWVDRLRRRPILIVTDLCRGLVLASIPVAYLFDALTIWQLYVVGFLFGICTVFFDVSYQSYLPSLVRKDQLVEGNSLLEVSRNAAQIGGPGMAGVLVGAITAPYAILVDAVSFVGSAGLLVAIRTEEEPPPVTEKPSMWGELREGLEYLVRHRYWRPISITTASSNFFWTLCGSIIIVYAVRELDLSAAVIGLTFSLGSIGGLVGAFIGKPVSQRLGVGPTIIASAVLFGPALMLVPLAPQSFPIPLLVASLHPGRGRSRALQHQRHQPHADAHARTVARPAQRLAALHRVGHDPARVAHRWRPGLRHRLARNVVGGSDRRLRLLRASRTVASPTHPRHADRFRGGSLGTARPGRPASATADA